MRGEWSRRAVYVEVVWTRVGNGGRLFGEGNNWIRCERCEVERKAKNGMDGGCEEG